MNIRLGALPPNQYPTPPRSPSHGGVSPSDTNHATTTTVLVSSRAVISGRLTAATVVVSPTSGKITAVYDSILPFSHFSSTTTAYVDVSPHVILPGLVDAHVHLNEPGRTQWEGFHTGTQAAASGGITTLVDMPLNSIPPTTTVGNLRTKVAAAHGQCWVDVGFYGGIIPGNVGELKDLVKAGVRGFKGFLIDSGVEEFPAVSVTDVAKVFAELADEPTTILFHAEMVPPDFHPPPPRGPPDSYAAFLSSRPPVLETHAISQILSLTALAPNLPLHIVHLSTHEAIPLLRTARAAGVHITAETCPHYLCLSAEGVPRGDTRHKCCPPIREQSNRDALWRELMLEPDPVISTVVSDHSPCTANLKNLPPHIPPGDDRPGKGSPGSFTEAWGGISSLGLTLPLLWTELFQHYHHRYFQPDPDTTLLKLSAYLSTHPARQVRLHHRKGAIGVGMDADFCIFDPEAEWVFAEDEPPEGGMWFKNKCSPYQGRRLRGLVRQTWLRGERIFIRDVDDGRQKFLGGPRGTVLLD